MNFLFGLKLYLLPRRPRQNLGLVFGQRQQRLTFFQMSLFISAVPFAHQRSTSSCQGKCYLPSWEHYVMNVVPLRDKNGPRGGGEAKELIFRGAGLRLSRL